MDKFKIESHNALLIYVAACLIFLFALAISGASEVEKREEALSTFIGDKYKTHKIV